MKKNRRILMALMGLEIGGAETHVVELAKYLSQNGYTVYAVSSGGVYEEELKKSGIRHFYAPLNAKSPLDIVKSYRTIKKIVKRERIDIIHAHARIPAFVCSLVNKVTKTPFITTVHGVYSSGFLFKHLTNWGQETICVSEDVKTYVKDVYSIPDERIHLTINGINQDTFSENADYSDLLEEFDISESDYKIIFVSRLDEGNCDGAYRLIEKGEEILKKIPNAKIIIVGSGTEYDTIDRRTSAFNKGHGKNLFHLAGARTDVYKFTAMADVVIGISRVALEAMSSGNVVILGGFGGYIGVFGEDKLNLCLDTNFTGRGCKEMTAEMLCDDIVRVYEMSDEEKNHLIGYGKEIVTERYSISAMAKSNIEAYDALLKREQRETVDFMISGYYGFHNSGDDTLLSAMTKSLKECDEDLNITVLSDNPKDTEEKYNVKSIKRINIIKIISAMKKTKVFISGGGSLIQDVTSTKSIMYYLFLMRLAKWMHLPVMVYANGVGPVDKARNIKSTVREFNRADLITLRETDSLEFLKKIGVDNENILVTADPTFTLDCADEKTVDSVMDMYNIPKDKKIIAVSLRNWKNAQKYFEREIAINLDEICEKYNLYPLFIPMQYPYDLDFSKKVLSSMKTEGAVIDKQYDGAILKGIFKKCTITLGMRLHSLIYSFGVGVPVIGLSYDPKVKSFLEYVKCPYYADVEKLNMSDLKETFDYCFENMDTIKNDIENNLNTMKKLAYDNVMYAMGLLNKGV